MLCQGFCLATKSESSTFQYNPSFHIRADTDKIILQMFQSDTRGAQVRETDALDPGNCNPD